MSHGLLLKKKEQQLQHQFMVQQQIQQQKALKSPSSSCRYDGSTSSREHVSSNNTEVSSSTSSSASSNNSSNRHSFSQFPFDDFSSQVGSGGAFSSPFLNTSYSAAALGSSTRSSCSALPSPISNYPTPPPSTGYIFPSYFPNTDF